MDEPLFSLAFVMVKESVVVPAVFFYLESAINKKKQGGHLNSFIPIRVPVGTKKLALVLFGSYVLMVGTNLYYFCVCGILLK